ncbi:MAG TPA: hypothetical protein VHY18_14660 [Solirubrobacteraceae bacterium]|jgi:hypothetical protein|nr:hypothetical protein [Solirubrobacteraceae bacterium]
MTLGVLTVSDAGAVGEASTAHIKAALLYADNVWVQDVVVREGFDAHTRGFVVAMTESARIELSTAQAAGVLRYEPSKFKVGQRVIIDRDKNIFSFEGLPWDDDEFYESMVDSWIESSFGFANVQREHGYSWPLVDHSIEKSFNLHLALAYFDGPVLRAAGGGTLLATSGGFADIPVPALASLSMGKAALRSAQTLIAAGVRDDAIHAATVTIAGAVKPGTDFDPNNIAELFWTAHTDSKDAWQTEYRFTGA